MKRKIFRVAVTGLAGSGKSTALNEFAGCGKNNFDVNCTISWDEIAKEVFNELVNDPKVKADILDVFGTIDRKQIAEIVFNTREGEEKLAWLEKLQYPLIIRRVLEREAEICLMFLSKDEEYKITEDEKNKIPEDAEESEDLSMRKFRHDNLTKLSSIPIFHEIPLLNKLESYSKFLLSKGVRIPDFDYIILVESDFFGTEAIDKRGCNKGHCRDQALKLLAQYAATTGAGGDIDEYVALRRSRQKKYENPDIIITNNNCLTDFLKKSHSVFGSCLLLSRKIDEIVKEKMLSRRRII